MPLLIPYEGQHIETGSIQFGCDLPGVFIRSDRALQYAMQINYILHVLEDSNVGVFVAAAALSSLRDLLLSCTIKPLD